MNFQKIIEKYLDTEAYGCNLILKEYCHFPKYLPLPCHMEHGWTPLSNALVSDLAIAKEKKLMLVYSERRIIAWKRASDIPVLIMGSPFVIYRRMKKIVLRPESEGTIVFPSHSTIFLKSQYNIDDYCLKLKKLPSEYQPVTICLLAPDIKMGRDKIYRQHGFSVVSAGDKLRGNISFVRNFYEILSNYKYATSNEIGTYSFYSVEMGIPFFLYGDEPTIVNVSKKDPNIGAQAKTSDFVDGKMANKLFSTGPNKKIKKSQADYVNYELGIEKFMSPKQMRELFFGNTKSFAYWYNKVPMYYLLSFAKKIVPSTFAYWLFKKINSK